jgi:hypothetical protein
MFSQKVGITEREILGMIKLYSTKSLLANWVEREFEKNEVCDIVIC